MMVGRLMCRQIESTKDMNVTAYMCLVIVFTLISIMFNRNKRTTKRWHNTNHVTSTKQSYHHSITSCCSYTTCALVDALLLLVVEVVLLALRGT